MTNLAQYLGGGGRYMPRSQKGAASHIGDFLCTKFDDIYDTLIPFFKKYPVVGVKSKGFQDWCLIAEIVKNGDHLTREGLNKVVELKSVLNKGELAIELAKAYPVINFIQRPIVLPENINAH